MDHMDQHKPPNDYEYNGNNGRRSWDKALYAISASVSSLQRDLVAVQERVLMAQNMIVAMNASIAELQRNLHAMDKTLVARVSTISVTERVLWLLVTIMVGLVVNSLK